MSTSDNSIAVVTMYNEAYKLLAEITVLNNIKQYAEYHNYKFICKDSDFPTNYIIYFEKSKLILDAFENSNIKWAWWIDVDALVTNFNIKLEQIIDDDYDIIISTDGAGINCGSFSVKNSERGKAWLDMIYANRFVYRYTSNKWPEQLVMHDTARNYTDIMKIVTQKTFNSYYYQVYKGVVNNVIETDRLENSGLWAPGDFVIHMPGLPNNLRIQYLKMFNELSVLRPNESDS